MNGVNTRHTNPGSALFQEQWTIYRKMVDHNYLFHREAYAILRDALEAEAPPGFHFLDVACGDARESSRALAGLPVGRYRGIDCAAAALDLAEPELRRRLTCGVTLTESDYMPALRSATETYHVIWIGLSLHHLLQPEKLSALTEIRRLLPPGQGSGLLLIYENTSPDGEAPAGWHARWDAQRPDWTAFAGEEWAAVADHVHREDHPETVSNWHRLGMEAGFHTVEQLYACPTDLFRLFAFR